MITAQNLTKRYGAATVVDDVSFACAPGTITGFLGPNGAGKSTTLRMLTGLSRASSGSATIAGVRYVDLPNPGRVVGVMLDAAAQHAGRTGLETLEIAASLMGLPQTRAAQMLERVGIADAARRRVGAYSLGMRQRLGLGAALLGDPQVLILDEPANGMDPAGIRWMRDLLRDFARRGGTVLLSSHLLGEVQATVDRLVVIGRGRIVADGTLSELLHRRGTLARVLDGEAFARALREAKIEHRIGGDGGIRVTATAEEVGRLAARCGAVLTHLRDDDAGSLEDVFFELTNDPDAGRGEDRPAAVAAHA